MIIVEVTHVVSNGCGRCQCNKMDIKLKCTDVTCRKMEYSSIGVGLQKG